MQTLHCTALHCTALHCTALHTADTRGAGNGPPLSVPARGAHTLTTLQPALNARFCKKKNWGGFFRIYFLKGKKTFIYLANFCKTLLSPVWVAGGPNNKVRVYFPKAEWTRGQRSHLAGVSSSQKSVDMFHLVNSSCAGSVCSVPNCHGN